MISHHVMRVLLCIVGLAACKPSLVIDRNAAYVVGLTNDIVSLDEGHRRQVAPKLVDGSVLIATRLASKRVKFCSGTMIAPAEGGGKARILTNHHCFAKAGEDEKATPELYPEACTSTTVYFGFLPGQAATAFSAGCEAGTLRTDYLGDIAVFTLSRMPPAPYAPVAFWSGEDAPVGRDAVIVHFPDIEDAMEAPPEGGVKLPTAAVTLQDCKTLGPFEFDEWDLDRTLPYSLRHSCDLIHGSSGSGLFDAETSQLIGVNWGGIKITVDGTTRIDNVATRIGYISAFLDGRVEDAMRVAQDLRVSGDARASSSASRTLKEKSGLLGKKVKGCGTLDGGSVGVNKGSFGVLLGGLALPVLTLLVRRGRRKPEARRFSLALLALLVTPVLFWSFSLSSEARANVNTNEAWASSYLFHAATVSEYLRVYAAFSDEPGRKTYFSRPEGRLLAARAGKARAEAQRLGQSLREAEMLEQLLQTHKPALKDAAWGPHYIELKGHWEALTQAGQGASAECSVHQSEAFAAQHKGDATAWLPAVLKQGPEGASCMFITLAKNGEDILPLYLALQYRGATIAALPVVRKLAATAYVERQEYAEALRLVVGLIDSDAAFRVPYEMVQRAFSMSQKGDGSVALRGM